MKVGVIGGAGYAAGELISILSRHPEVEFSFVTSNSQTGLSVRDFHSDFGIPSDLKFVKEHNSGIDVLFLCGGHGNSKKFLEDNEVPAEVTIIDLSADFRTDSTFVYGLPEINAKKLSSRIANPGCFATAIQLALLPVATEINGEVHSNAITGSTGAGQALSDTGHFSWRSANVSTYKVFEHQHLNEIESTLRSFGSTITDLNFIPVRGPFTRGIFATSYFDTDLTDKQSFELFSDFYSGAAFTKVSKDPIDLKRVTQTNLCLIHTEVQKGKLIITSAIDNLIKGAAGQAVQNMNLRFGFQESSGLNLKPGGF